MRRDGRKRSGALLLGGCCVLGSSCFSPDPADELDTAMPLGQVSTLPISTSGLVAYWPLDTDFHDAIAQHPLVPFRNGGFASAPFPRNADNQSYGPTQATTDDGASTPALTALDSLAGITLEGWFLLPDNSANGMLFGFGPGGWGIPKLNVSVAWGFLDIQGGAKADSVNVYYSRLGDGCWHHVALVLPPGYAQGAPFHVYVDGLEDTPHLIDRSPTVEPSFLGSQLFGQPFGIGRFTGTSAGKMRVDEVRLWSRALAPEEVGALAIPTGTGDACATASTPGWSPGALCTTPDAGPPPTPKLTLRALSDDTLVVVSDPTDYLLSRIAAECGTALGGLEASKGSVPSWQYTDAYSYAARETLLAHRPTLLAGLSAPDHFHIHGLGLDTAPSSQSLWPQATRELRIPALGTAPGEKGETYTFNAEVAYYSYLSLPAHLSEGQTYTVTDAWGNAAHLTWDASTISWALKVNQLGYQADAGWKYAYLGAWLGPAGAMDLSRFDGAPFTLRREADGVAVFQGVIQLRAADGDYQGAPLTGETVYQLDFSTFSLPGRYHLSVPGLGRSFAFTIGQDALGEAFYTHARGLYHQRCAPLTTAHTAWARGDIHATFQGGAPPDADDYQDHAAEGWGFLDADQHFAQVTLFHAVALTATTQPLPAVVGGWHDAADFDRNPGHLQVVQDLAASYLLFPDNFSDGQLHLPESGNGVADILDEAVFGLEIFRRAQAADGRVGTHVEATTHPTSFDPGADAQPYYLSLATRRSSLHYAARAALLGRALAEGGDLVRSALFVQSARAAYVFGTREDLQISFTFTDPEAGGQQRSWREPPAVDARRRLHAAIQLWLATGESAYRDALDTMSDTLADEVAAMYWRTGAFDLIDVALFPAKFPAGWAEQVSAGIHGQADFWMDRQAKNPYRKVWYTPSDGYFPLMGWGKNGFNHLRWLVAAFRLTGSETYRDGALLGVDWMHGANPQGRVYTSGLGRVSMVNFLHLPSFIDGVDEPVPGITPYALTGTNAYAGAKEVYGLFADPHPTMAFPGSALAQLPPPWNNAGLDLEDVRGALDTTVPLWRRFTALEQQNVPQAEFAIAETVSPAVAVTGCLLGPGWKPSPALMARKPRSRADLQDAWLYQP